MSKAVICDECGRILKSTDALHCCEAITKDGRNVYGADICKDCLPQFDKKMDINGWNLSYKKELKVGGEVKVKKHIKDWRKWSNREECAKENG